MTGVRVGRCLLNLNRHRIASLKRPQSSIRCLVACKVSNATMSSTTKVSWILKSDFPAQGVDYRATCWIGRNRAPPRVRVCSGGALSLNRYRPVFDALKVGTWCESLISGRVELCARVPLRMCNPHAVTGAHLRRLTQVLNLKWLTLNVVLCTSVQMFQKIAFHVHDWTDFAKDVFQWWRLVRHFFLKDPKTGAFLTNNCLWKPVLRCLRWTWGSRILRKLADLSFNWRIMSCWKSQLFLV